MKKILALTLALLVMAGCGQSETTTAGNETAAGQAPAAAAAETTATAAETTAAEASAAAVQTSAAGEASNQPAAASAAAGAAADTGADQVQTIQLAQADLSAVEAAGFVEGRHYRLISPAQPTTASPGRVEVNEFFMHSCIHCFNLEPYVQAWLEDKPDYIDFVRVPTTWDAYRQLHAAAWYAAETLGIADEINLPFFREIHDSQNYLDTPEKLASFFARFDVPREDFESLLSSFAVITKVNRADELGRRYRVDSTPTIVINGKYRTGVDMAGSYEQLFALIEALAAAELGR